MGDFYFISISISICVGFEIVLYWKALNNFCLQPFLFVFFSRDISSFWSKCALFRKDNPSFILNSHVIQRNDIFLGLKEKERQREA